MAGPFPHESRSILPQLGHLRRDLGGAASAPLSGRNRQCPIRAQTPANVLMEESRLAAFEAPETV
jgi:hypothetical protein